MKRLDEAGTKASACAYISQYVYVYVLNQALTQLFRETLKVSQLIQFNGVLKTRKPSLEVAPTTLAQKTLQTTKIHHEHPYA